jgi:hypothetical protein
MASFGALPDDVIALVLSKLRRRDAARSSLACKSWRTLSAAHRLALKRGFFYRRVSTSSHLQKWFQQRNFTALNDAFRTHHLHSGQACRLGVWIAGQMHPLPAEAPAVMRRLVLRGFDLSRMNENMARGGVFTHACRLWNQYGQDPEQEPLRRDIATILLQNYANPDFLGDVPNGVRRNIHDNPPAIFWLMSEPAWLSVLLSETRKSTILADLNVRLGRYDPGPSGAGWTRRDVEGEMTPLMWLAVGRGLGVVATFISEPKAVECASLILNAYNDCFKGLRANPTLQDRAGRTAASMARSRERHRLAEVLEAACERWRLEPPGSP